MVHVCMVYFQESGCKKSQIDLHDDVSELSYRFLQ